MFILQLHPYLFLSISSFVHFAERWIHRSYQILTMDHALQLTVAFYHFANHISTVMAKCNMPFMFSVPTYEWQRWFSYSIIFPTICLYSVVSSACAHTLESALNSIATYVCYKSCQYSANGTEQYWFHVMCSAPAASNVHIMLLFLA